MLLRTVLSPNVRFRLRQRTLDTPGLCELFTRFDRTLTYARITDSTRLILDGYPRSGNTYARAAVLYANGPELGVSTHGHSARFVEQGIRKGLPVVVLLRDPVAAVTSRLHLETMTDSRLLVRAYRRYYSRVAAVRDKVLIAPFDAVVGDFGTVIRACNDVFATNLAIYEKTPVSEATIRAAIDREAEELVGSAWLASPWVVRRS
ncbi:MAG: hypothetical protein LC797_24875 [Chloroflexi bacterium]|nr:hypothetical protein [Chloroflexota bacterium]